MQTDTNQPDTESRRLFVIVRDEMQALNRQIDEMLTLANSMRRTHSAAALALAEIEHRYVDQSFGKRKSDALLHEANARLQQMAYETGKRVTGALKIVKGEATKLDRLKVQADRIAFEKAIDDPEKGAPIPGIEYVGYEFFIAKLGTGLRNVQMLQQDGKLPEPDAIGETTGRCKPLWTKANAIIAVHRYETAKAAQASQC